jgi:hypothetical protein
LATPLKKSIHTVVSTMTTAVSARRPGCPTDLEIALPTDPASQLADSTLRTCLHQQPQGLVDDTTFRGTSARPQCLLHQAVVDVDVGAHLDLYV